jgi:hypothetical protein
MQTAARDALDGAARDPTDLRSGQILSTATGLESRGQPHSLITRRWSSGSHAKIQSRNVHTGRNQRAEHLLRRSRGTDRTDDFRSPASLTHKRRYTGAGSRSLRAGVLRKLPAS